MHKPTDTQEPPWVVTLFDPPTLRVSPQEYQTLLADPVLRAQLPPVYRFVPLHGSRRPLAARLRACRRAWARHGWQPYDRDDRFNWTEEDGGLVQVEGPEEEDV
jgi:hypothetical protein